MKKSAISAIVLALLLPTIMQAQQRTSITSAPRSVDVRKGNAENTGLQNYTETVNGVSFEMVALEGGTFQMGSNNGDGDEKPVHSVSLSNFCIGKTEVTQELWQAVMGNNPSNFKGDNLPVEQVSWNDVQEFITKLDQLTGKSYRLPTEAEWEYAAREGGNSPAYDYNGSNNIDDVACAYEESVKSTYPVGTKQPNGLGIYDMDGNVWEWCADWYGENYYSNSPGKDPSGPPSGTYRVSRGSTCGNGATIRYVGYPEHRDSFLGFRLAQAPR